VLRQFCPRSGAVLRAPVHATRPASIPTTRRPAALARAFGELALRHRPRLPKNKHGSHALRSPHQGPSRLLKTSLPGSSGRSDHALMRRSRRAWLPCFIFGSAAGAAELARQKLEQELPALRVVGYRRRTRRRERVPEVQRPILDRIAAAQPDLLLVALGAPKQELGS